MTDTLAHTVGVGWLRCNLKKEKKSCPRKRRIEFVPIRWQWQEHKPCLFYDGGFISKEKKKCSCSGEILSKMRFVTLISFSSIPSLSHLPRFRHLCQDDVRACLTFALHAVSRRWSRLDFFFFFSLRGNVAPTWMSAPRFPIMPPPPPARRCVVTSSEARNRVAGESVTRLGLSMFVFPVVRLINHEYFMTACSPLDSTSPCDGEC